MFKHFEIQITVGAVTYHHGLCGLESHAEGLKKAILEAAKKYSAENNIALSIPIVEVVRPDK